MVDFSFDLKLVERDTVREIGKLIEYKSYTGICSPVQSIPTLLTFVTLHHLLSPIPKYAHSVHFLPNIFIQPPLSFFPLLAPARFPVKGESISNEPFAVFLADGGGGEGLGTASIFV